MSKKIFFPSEKIADEEEYSAGQGTYNDNGIIRASNIGEAEFDEERRVVKIKTNVVRKANRGDIVYGKVVDVKESMAIVELIKAEKGSIITNTRATLPVRNIAKSYVSKIDEFYKTGDFVKAKISDMDKYSTDLLTNETGLGVMNAYCKKCKSNLSFSSGKMMCLTCGNTETRKWFEAEDKETPREDRPRREFDRGERRDNRGYNRDRIDRRGGFRNNRNGSNDRNRGHFSGNRNNNKHSGGQNFRGGRR